MQHGFIGGAEAVEEAGRSAAGVAVDGMEGDAEGGPHLVAAVRAPAEEPTEVSTRLALLNPRDLTKPPAKEPATGAAFQ